ncbi:uncharacterized protein EV420DRAFT_738761 [Desarmillaria tabescens]|uniref:Uncharacterized protein n=1 Tax=Armillaria tabescens TaxID=1929756 RepID=A0AA39JZV8_ARMTA|nr:uncharacterized protein EV420DRAFT_738761 [Desarmillaria tabescens]KAK0450534.1 hypothetical protein EV420DRAFT_738761 [Desarmillaria tabescens]
MGAVATRGALGGDRCLHGWRAGAFCLPPCSMVWLATARGFNPGSERVGVKGCHEFDVHDYRPFIRWHLRTKPCQRQLFQSAYGLVYSYIEYLPRDPQGTTARPTQRASKVSHSIARSPTTRIFPIKYTNLKSGPLNHFPFFAAPDPSMAVQRRIILIFEEQQRRLCLQRDGYLQSIP